MEQELFARATPVLPTTGYTGEIREFYLTSVRSTVCLTSRVPNDLFTSFTPCFGKASGTICYKAAAHHALVTDSLNLPSLDRRHQVASPQALARVCVLPCASS